MAEKEMHTRLDNEILTYLMRVYNNMAHPHHTVHQLGPNVSAYISHHHRIKQYSNLSPQPHLPAWGKLVSPIPPPPPRTPLDSVDLCP